MDRTLEPVQVSPLIKGARWGFLIAGIIYGSSRYSMLRKKYQKKMEELERTRPEREAKQAAEKARLFREDMEGLEKELGISFDLK